MVIRTDKQSNQIDRRSICTVDADATHELITLDAEDIAEVTDRIHDADQHDAITTLDAGTRDTAHPSLDNFARPCVGHFFI